MQVHAYITDTTVRLVSADTLMPVAEQLIANLPPGEDINAQIKDWADTFDAEVVSTEPWPELTSVGTEHKQVGISLTGPHILANGTKLAHLYISHNCGSVGLMMDAASLRQIIIRANLALNTIA
jgi:hypothetical protein